MVGVAAANVARGELQAQPESEQKELAAIYAALLVPVVAGTSLVVLTALGALAARTGGAPVLRAALRVGFWGALAMGLTAAAGKLFGAVG